MLATDAQSRNEGRRQTRKSRSLEAIYHEQRPEGVSHADWASVFDSFLVEWARSLAFEAVQNLPRRRTVVAA